MDFSNIIRSASPPSSPSASPPCLSSSPLMTPVSYCPLSSTFSHLPKQSLSNFLESVGFFQAIYYNLKFGTRINKRERVAWFVFLALGNTCPLM